MFDIGRTYKFMVDKNYSQPSIYTITIDEEDEIFIKGIDIKGMPRGIKKEAITDWILLDE